MLTPTCDPNFWITIASALRAYPPVASRGKLEERERGQGGGRTPMVGLQHKPREEAHG